MTTTIAGLFPTPEAARDAAQALTAQGVPTEEIGLVGGNAHGRYDGHSEATDNAVTGAEAGAVAGGATGFLLGAVAFAIPVVGPVVAAGTLAATLGGAALGAAAGGLIGALTHLGLPEDDAAHYAAQVRHGQAVLTVHAPEGQATSVAQTLQRHGATQTTFGGVPPEAAARARRELAELPPAPPDVHFQSTTPPTQVGEDPIQEIAIGRETR